MLPYWYRYARMVAEAVVVNTIIIAAALTLVGKAETVNVIVIGTAITLLDLVK
jgi:hypothetical protein